MEIMEKRKVQVPSPMEAPFRAARKLGPYLVSRDLEKCIACGMCEIVCPRGVHERKYGYAVMSSPKSGLCDSCGSEPECVLRCPRGALEVGVNPLLDVVGDERWTGELIAATWMEAETGMPPTNIEHQVGNSGGGFDRLSFRIPHGRSAVRPEDVNLSIDLNKREVGQKMRIGVPWYGGGMSYGSVSMNVILARAMAASWWDTFVCTGEGGYPDELTAFKDHVITQVATGLFGVREETIALIASEKQAIDAVLGELAAHNKGFDEVADRYWNARGGSHTDGGAFIFTLRNGVLEATNKFGAPVDMDTLPYRCGGTFTDEDGLRLQQLAQREDGEALFSWMVDNIGWLDIESALEHLISLDCPMDVLIHCLTLMLDRRYDPVSVRRSAVLSRVQRALNKLLASCPPWAHQRDMCWWMPPIGESYVPH